VSDSHARIGNRVGVFGTLFRDTSIRVSYVIDDTEPSVQNYSMGWDLSATYGDAIYNFSFYESPLLEYGEHILNVTILEQESANNTIGDTFYALDYLTIGTRDSKDSDLVIVDDNDPSVTYSSFLSGSPSYVLAYRDSVHTSDSPGSSAMFTFNGSSIEVYGNIGVSEQESTRVISFQLDDGEPEGYYSYTSNYKPSMLFYSKSGLSAGLHTLRIESLTSFTMTLDYFLYNSSSIAATTISSKKEPTGAIIGGVLGGVAAILSVLLLLLFYRRRLRPFDQEDDEDRGGSMGYTSFIKAPLTVDPPNPTPPRDRVVRKPQLPSSYLLASRGQTASNTALQGSQQPEGSLSRSNVPTSQPSGSSSNVRGNKSSRPSASQSNIQRHDVVQVPESNLPDNLAPTRTEVRGRSSPPPSYSEQPNTAP
jgi:hypothetical protein